MPTLGQVIQDINDYDDAHKDDDDATARELDTILKTRLRGPAELFGKFVRQLENSQRIALAATARTNAERSMEW